MIQVPNSISENLSFRWFVEYVIDNSPKFATSSAIAKASLLLSADLDTPGPRAVDEHALKTLRQAITDEETPLPLPSLEKSVEGGAPIKCSPRIFATYIESILHDVDAADEASLTADKVA